MSLFSYIAFPRPVDKSCLTSRFDKSKAFTVGELRGTDFERQINGGLNGLPDCVNVYLGDMSDFWGMNILDKHTESFQNTFKNEFIYRLEADFGFGNPDEYFKECEEIYRRCGEDERGGQSEAEFMEFARKTFNHIQGNVALCRRQLYDIFQLNIIAPPTKHCGFADLFSVRPRGPFSPRLKCYPRRGLADTIFRRPPNNLGRNFKQDRYNAKPGECIEIFSVWLGGENADTFGPPAEVRVIDAEQVLSSALLDLQAGVKFEISRVCP
ncbi:MAG: hypothetical protein LBG71_00020 [Clostridiales Family XIII bacterium]|nr:hypothetical protein [Clostridiales Family XIII bacterium]